jgi:cytochrome b subunit of formate dehydrogenase
MLLKKSLPVLCILVLVLGVGIYLSYTTFKGEPLFDQSWAIWVLLVASVIGFILGIARGLFKKRNAIVNGVAIRHGIGSFVSHWGTALGIFVLMISGFLMGFLFISPTANTLEQIIPVLNMHFFAVILTLFGGFFFVGDYLASRDWALLLPNWQDITGGFFGKYFLRRKWDKEHKYLSSQKAAFIPFAVLGLLLVVTGAIKVGAHVWPISANAWGWATIIHDISALLAIIYLVIHVGMVVLLGHWPALFSWFTGTVTTKVVEHEYPMWEEELKTGKKQPYKPF